jgi:hypothetical protein
MCTPFLPARPIVTPAAFHICIAFIVAFEFKLSTTSTYDELTAELQLLV